MKNKKPNKAFLIVLIAVNLCVFSFVAYKAFVGKTDKTTSQEIAYSEFINKLNDNELKEVTVSSSKVNAKEVAEDGTVINYYTQRFSDPNLVDRLADAGVEFTKEADTGKNAANIFLTLLQVGMMATLVIVFCRKTGQLNKVGKMSNSKTDENKSNVKFKDIAGEDEAKESLAEIVDFLHNPEKYQKIGAKLPKGALLVGPPGTGKTMLAKAVAGEANVPFFNVSGSDFVEMYVGVGAARIRSLFDQARKNCPCIIFIDEIDAIGRKREGSTQGSDEREGTLNQLLSEMDGFDSKKGIILLGATNRPEILDKALLRPGRFDRRVIVENPDITGREEILKVHSKGVKISEEIDFHKIALATSGASGADLANIINEAAIDAAKNEREVIVQDDLMKAVETVFVGKEKKGRVLSQKEKEIVAYHEIGHAVATAVQKNTEPVQKITIIPRTMGALGFVMQSPEEEKYLKTKEELEESVISLLAGRAAEEIFFNTITTGASNDIEKATEIVRSMITQYGMNEKFGMVALSKNNNKYLSNQSSLICSPGVAEKIDTEISSIMLKSYEKAKVLLNKNKSKIDELAKYLILHETITGEEFMKIFESEDING